MAKEQDRGKDEPTTTKADQPDKKLPDLTGDNDKDVKGGGGGTGGNPARVGGPAE